MVCSARVNIESRSRAEAIATFDPPPQPALGFRNRQSHPDEPRRVAEGRVSMPFCTQCGQENPPDANFCSRCGARMASAESSPSDSTSTLAFTRDDVDREDSIREDVSDLGPADQAAVDAL